MATYTCGTDGCERPRRGNHPVCGACAQELPRIVGDLPWLYEQLLVTFSRADVLIRAGGRRTLHRSGTPADAGVSYDERAGMLAKRLMIAMDRWVIRLQRHDLPDLPGPLCSGKCGHESCQRIRFVRLWRPPPTGTVKDLAAWLGRHATGHLRTHDVDAPQAIAEFTSLRDAAMAAIDHPPDRALYAGPCPRYDCPGSLYALPGARMITCTRCDRTLDRSSREDRMRDEARAVVTTAAAAAWTITSLGTNVTAPRIRQWAHRGALLDHGRVRGHPVYQIGEIMDLLDQAAERAAEAARKRAARQARRNLRNAG